MRKNVRLLKKYKERGQRTPVYVLVNKLRKKELDTLGQEKRKNSVKEDRGHQYIGKQVTKEEIRHTGTRE